MENPDFENTQKAFSSKNARELNYSYWLFQLMKNPGLVRLFSKLTIFSLRIGLPVQSLIKSTIFRQFCAGESLVESVKKIRELGKLHVGSILDYSIEGKEREEDFENTKVELLHIINIARNNRSIPYTCLKLTGIARVALLLKVSEGAVLGSEEARELTMIKNRFNEICLSCFGNDVPIYIDAEEYRIQGAIDRLTEEMMIRYNSGRAIVQTTLQLYRWDRIAYLKKLINWAKRDKFFIGVKLVRGAYWDKENERANRLNYKSPVHPHKEDTDRDFDRAVDLCLENIELVTLCAGTHNEASTMHLVHKMRELGIANNDERVYCSQLFGMSDHITFNLAASGYNVTKYLPYGPVKSVIPYLIRRAEENTSIAGQMSRELKLISEEKERRLRVKLLA